MMAACSAIYAHATVICTAGCNLACKFCQNWDIRKSRETDRLSEIASPADIARTTQKSRCRGVAFTYNDPVIFMEYAIDCAVACKEIGINAVAATAGYIGPRPRKEFFAQMDATNIDLKAFSNTFYKRICGGELGDVAARTYYCVTAGLALCLYRHKHMVPAVAVQGTT